MRKEPGGVQFNALLVLLDLSSGKPGHVFCAGQITFFTFLIIILTQNN